MDPCFRAVGTYCLRRLIDGRFNIAIDKFEARCTVPTVNQIWRRAVEHYCFVCGSSGFEPRGMYLVINTWSFGAVGDFKHIYGGSPTFCNDFVLCLTRAES